MALAKYVIDRQAIKFDLAKTNKCQRNCLCIMMSQFSDILTLISGIKYETIEIIIKNYFISDACKMLHFSQFKY